MFTDSDISGDNLSFPRNVSSIRQAFEQSLVPGALLAGEYIPN